MIALIAVQSINGFITRNDEPDVGFASKEDWQWFNKTLSSMDLVLMGSSTFKAAAETITKNAEAGPPRWIFTRHPEKYESHRIPCKLEFLQFDPVRLKHEINDYAELDVALVGGPDLNDLFLQNNLIDQIWITIEPHFFSSGKMLFNQFENFDLSLLDFQLLSKQTVLLKYKIN